MGFKDAFKDGYSSEKDRDMDFATPAEARHFFKQHWAHGASNEGNIYGTVCCYKCKGEWEFVGRKSAGRGELRSL